VLDLSILRRGGAGRSNLELGNCNKTLERSVPRSAPWGSSLDRS
jgi:hypothetical protein